MTTTIEDGSDEFLAVARQALRTGDPSSALDSLGWWHLLSGVSDDESRAAVFALFRAQGRELVSSPALGALMAQPYLRREEADEVPVVAVIHRSSRRRGPVAVAVGDVGRVRLLVDRPGHGAAIVDPDRAVLRSIDIPGRLQLHEVDLEASAWRPTISEEVAARARSQSIALGRVAIALEMLGAAEGALARAVEHAHAREQFGQPIGRFQAVRHLLAWAMTDCAAIETAASSAVALGTAAPPRYDEIVKALAGRNARRACERSLQALGAIGFTAEHTHHHFHSRVLALDSLLGTSSELAHDLGRWLREQGADPRIPYTLLNGSDARARSREGDRT